MICGAFVCFFGCNVEGFWVFSGWFLVVWVCAWVWFWCFRFDVLGLCVLGLGACLVVLPWCGFGGVNGLVGFFGALVFLLRRGAQVGAEFVV